MDGKIFFNFEGCDITVAKNQHGMYDCHCSHSACSATGKKGLTSAEGLKKHMKRLKSHWIGPVEVSSSSCETVQHTIEKERAEVTSGDDNQPIDKVPSIPDPRPPQIDRVQNVKIPVVPLERHEHQSGNTVAYFSQGGPQTGNSSALKDQLLHHPYLDTINVVVDPDLLVLCCQTCQVALPPSQMPSHIGNAHSAVRVDDDKYCGAVADMKIASALPSSVAGGLRIHDGLACDSCTFACGSRDWMARHHRDKHPTVTLPKQWSPCKTQQLNNGSNRKFWRVAGDDDVVCDHQEVIDKMRKEMADVIRVEQVPQEKRMVSPWLLTTKWHEHVAGHDVGTLRKLVEFPKADDLTMPDISHGVEMYFDGALRLLEVTDELVLQRLNSPDPLKGGINNTPLHRHQEAATQKDYVRIATSLLAMLLRADEGEDYSIPLPEDLIDAIIELEDALTEKTGVEEKIHAVLTKVWMVKWTKQEGNPIPCPTERFMALSTLEADGGHKQPVYVTNPLARLEYCIRLVCLKELKILSASLYGGDDEAACDALQTWFTEKTNSPFSRIRSLQHRASAIAYRTMSPSCVWWLDRETWHELLYGGNRIHIDRLRQMFAGTEEQMVELWEKKVLVGLSTRVVYEDIADDNTNHDVGYSFLSDRRNVCFADRDRFLKALTGEKELFSRFAVIRNGELIWNMGALMGWLRDYAEFQKLILIRCEMLSGAPGRGTELTAMIYRNTKACTGTRSQRNLVMLGRNLTMLRTYHKSGALSGMDKLIPHSIDGVTADLIIQDLALTRPFAEVVAHVCFPDRPAIKEMYQTHLFVNNHKLFNTDQLTATMARVSIPFLGFGLGVNSWRHISIAFKRKLGRFAEDLLEDDEQDTVEALQAGHNRSTENRVYGLSPDALAGAPEDLLPLFLQASTNWQLVMHTVPGGLQLAYTLARSHKFKQLAESGRFGPEFQRTNPPAAAAAIAIPPQGAEVMLSMQNSMMAKIETELVASIGCRIAASIVDALVPAVDTIIRNALSTAMPQQSASNSQNCWPSDERLKYAGQEEAYVMGSSQETQITTQPSLDLSPRALDASKVWHGKQKFRSTSDFTSGETGRGAAAIGLDAPSPLSADNNKLAGIKSNHDNALSDVNDHGSNQSKAIEILSESKDEDEELSPPPPPNQLVKDKDSILENKSLWTLRVLLNDERASWWSAKQRDAVLSVLKQETDVIAMLKTGGGKSMLAIIPAIMDTKNAVVVALPLKSLMTDWERKLKSMGVRFQVYSPTVPLLKDVNLILVSADRVGFKTWRQHLAELNEVLRVGRFVFDEAHLPLLSGNFREALRHVNEIRQFPMQLVLLSGTVTQSNVAALKAAFGLADNAVEIRESCNRPELEYIMKTPAPSIVQENMVIQIMESERRSWTSEDRGLVFVTYMEDGESLVNKSGWPFYNGSKGMSDASRVRCYSDWFAGKCPVMICTSAFSTGNDYPHVRAVIHLKTPFEMTEIIQAQGRGGRDGRPARCYILPSPTPPKITIGRSEVDHKGLWYAQDYIYRYGLNRCLRYGLTLYIDGEGTECRRHESNQWCCVCKADSNHDPSRVRTPSGKQNTHVPPTSIIRPSAPAPRTLTHQQSISVNKRTIDHVPDSSGSFVEMYKQAKKSRTNRLDDEMKQVERMRKALDKMKDRGCPPCNAFGDKGGRSGHPMFRCPSLEQLGVSWELYRAWKTSILYHKHKGICWICHVPTCRDELHAPLEKGKTVCDWPDLVLPLALAAFRQKDIREAVQKYFGVVWLKIDEFNDWLMKAPSAGRHSKGMDLMLWPSCPPEWTITKLCNVSGGRHQTWSSANCQIEYKLLSVRFVSTISFNLEISAHDIELLSPTFNPVTDNTSTTNFSSRPLPEKGLDIPNLPVRRGSHVTLRDWSAEWLKEKNKAIFGSKYHQRALIALEFLEQYQGNKSAFLAVYPEYEEGRTAVLAAVKRAKKDRGEIILRK
ncbi:hypothetical protein BDR03DRAFT_987079 [Suillus americanus]|nr:hypothetical protein BDR03DRAFT_987079 [Suillus americanus]